MSLTLPAAAPSLAGRELILGVRPEHLLLGGGNLPMQVETVEMLGAEHLIHGVVAGHDVIVRTGPQDNPAPGTTLQLGFKPDAVHWFDAATRRPRRRLTYSFRRNSQSGLVHSPYRARAWSCSLKPRSAAMLC